MRRAWAGLTLLGTLLTCDLALGEPGHIALVVGANQGYPEETPLRFAEDDAERMASALSEWQIEVVLLQQPTAQQLRQSLSELSKRQAGLLTVFYAGHGDSDHLHLGDEPFPVGWLTQTLADARAGLKLLVIDACRSDLGIRQRGMKKVSEHDVAITTLGDPSTKGMVQIWSTGHGQLAQESEALRGGVFTHFWISGLRGAADLDQDGKVRLGEAYHYAASNTSAYTTTKGASVQRPAFRFDLSGAADPILSTPSQASAKLILPPHPQALYVVQRLPTAEALVTMRADPRREIEVGIPTGYYRVVRIEDTQIGTAMRDLPWGGEARLRADDFYTEPVAQVAMRGGLPPPSTEHWISVAGALIVEERQALTAQSVVAAYGFRLAEPYAFFGVSGEVGWLRRELQLVDSPDMVRADVLRLAVGPTLYVSLEPLLLLLHLRVRGDYVWQELTRGHAKALAAAGLPTRLSSTSWRAGPTVGAELRVPVWRGLGLAAMAQGGALLEPVEDLRLRAVGEGQFSLYYRW